MPKQEDVLFGKIAIKNRLVDEEKVRKCLSAIERGGNGKSLGQFMAEKGLITAGQFKAISAHLKQSGVSTSSEVSGPSAATKQRPSLRRSSDLPDPSGLGIPASEVAKKDYSHLAGKSIDDYLVEARRVGASDLHFQVDSPPFMRMHGEIVFLKHPHLTAEDTLPKILEILDEKGREVFERDRDYDFCYIAEHGRYRANFLKQRKGFDAIFRIIPDHIATLEELHLPQALGKFTKYRQGIVLLTGPSGCGKTATMTALIDIINQEQHDHIVLVEDPIEYVFKSKNCNVNQRQVKRHTENYASALRSAMRSDPDYICVGEMRDLETVSMAITAAETGHLVFATLHTTNAIRSVDRIIDIFPPKEQEQIRAMVSESLRGVVSQILVPRADGLGREPALEILFVNQAVGNLIRERKTFQLASVLQTGAKQGMVTMDDSLKDLLRRKLITREMAEHHAYSKEIFK